MPVKTPAYMARPELFAYNKKTMRHILKTSAAYMRGPPEDFQETVERLRETGNLLVVTVPGAEPKAPLPIDIPVDPEQVRKLIGETVRGEIAQNPSAYSGKQVPELETLFRQMLIAKLLPKEESKVSIGSTMSAVKKLVKKPTSKPKPKFVVKPVQMSDSEDGETEAGDETC